MIAVLNNMSYDNYGQLPAYLIPDPAGPSTFHPRQQQQQSQQHQPAQTSSSQAVDASPSTKFDQSIASQRKRKRSADEEQPSPALKQSKDGSSSPQFEPRKKNKLGYHRTSVACAHCRRRKIRCIIPENDETGICTNCSRLKKDCYFHPADQGGMSRGKQAPPPSASIGTQQQQPPMSHPSFYHNNPGLSPYGNYSNVSSPPQSLHGLGVYDHLPPNSSVPTAHGPGWHTPATGSVSDFGQPEGQHDSLAHQSVRNKMDAFASPSGVSQFTAPYSRSPSYNTVPEHVDLDNSSSHPRHSITSQPRQPPNTSAADQAKGNTPRSWSYAGLDPYSMGSNPAATRERAATLPNFYFNVDQNASPASSNEGFSDVSGGGSMTVPLAQYAWTSPLSENSPTLGQQPTMQQRGGQASRQGTPTVGGGGGAVGPGGPTSHPSAAARQPRRIPTHISYVSDMFNGTQGPMPPGTTQQQQQGQPQPTGTPQPQPLQQPSQQPPPPPPPQQQQQPGSARGSVGASPQQHGQMGAPPPAAVPSNVPAYGPTGVEADRAPGQPAMQFNFNETAWFQ